MTMIYCAYLKTDAQALEKAPWPGELGEQILKEISKPAWQEWLQHQTMLINEKRLSPRNKEHRDYLERQMRAFLFGGDVDQAEGYVPPNNDD